MGDRTTRAIEMGDSWIKQIPPTYKVIAALILSISTIAGTAFTAGEVVARRGLAAQVAENTTTIGAMLESSRAYRVCDRRRVRAELLDQIWSVNCEDVYEDALRAIPDPSFNE